ncbi:Lrp/AsnC family transcriptional regulator [Candidatus Woesearchaeota archaeon]|nr:Lrp/AsnC family transcriptional regulator [Candidatus Woesearchaeota archaeon]
MDDKDWKILEMLENNAKLSNSQIAKKTTIPITTVHNRIKRMESEGIIKQYTIKLDYEKINKPILAIILIEVNYNTTSKNKISQSEVAKSIKKIGAQSVDIVTGGTDIVIKVRTKSVQELNEFIINKLRNIEGVDKTQTLVVLESI